MPRIIREGRVPPQKVYRGTCGNCGTVSEFERDEFTRSEIADYFWNGNCPLCKKRVSVFEKKPTSPLLEMIFGHRPKTGRRNKTGLPIPAEGGINE